VGRATGPATNLSVVTVDTEPGDFTVHFADVPHAAAPPRADGAGGGVRDPLPPHSRLADAVIALKHERRKAVSERR
jgi:hypothetical protein